MNYNEMAQKIYAQNYNEMAQKIHAQNKAVGWWDDPDRCMFECLQLVSTEATEVELADALIRVLNLGGRLGLKHIGIMPSATLMRAWSVGRKHLEINEQVVRLAKCIKDDVPGVIKNRQYSNLLASIDTVALSFGYDLHGALLEKLEYTKAGGKAF